jgi:hypothetical protein
MFLEDDLLLPLERVCSLVVGGDEVVHVFAELARAGEAGSCQRLALQNGRPDFHLIHPRCVGGREVEVDILVPGQPPFAFGLMGVEIVQDDMNLATGVLGHDAVHKVEKLHAAPAPVMIAFHQSGATSRAANRVVVPCRL